MSRNKLNSGNQNSGDYNSGAYNTGHQNSGDYNTGMFNSDEPFMRMFNKQTNIKYSNFINSDEYPSFYGFNLNTWISESFMTEQEKSENPTHKTTGGYLKSIEYKTAWSIFWRNTDEENRQKFLNLPNFDAEIFKEITGIDVEEKTVELSQE